MAKYQVEAGQTLAIHEVGRYFRIFSSATDLHIKILGKGREYFDGALQSGVGIDFSDRELYPHPFDVVYINGESTQLIDVWHSLAKCDDDRLSGNFDINAALDVAQTAAKNHTVHPIQNISASQEVLPQRSSRKSALVQVNAPVYVGGAAGARISGEFSWDNQAALRLVPVSGTVEVRINEDWG